MKHLNWKIGALLVLIIPLCFLNLSLLFPENGFFFWKESATNNARLYFYNFNKGQKTTYQIEWEEAGPNHYVGYWSQEVLAKNPKGHLIAHKLQLKAASSLPKDPFTQIYDFKTVNTPKGDILQVSFQNLSEINKSWVKKFLQVSGLIFPEDPKKTGESWALKSFTSPFLAKREKGGHKIQKLKMGLFSIIKKEAKTVKESEIVFDSNSSRIYSFHLKNDKVTLKMKLENLSI